MKTKTALLGSLLTTTWTVAAFAAVTFTVVRLTDSAGCSRHPSSSGSGKLIVFASEGDLVTGENADGNFEIFLRDAKTGLRQITDTTGGFNDDPSINKAGNRIAFVSDRDLVTGENTDANTELFLFDKKKGFVQITDTTGGTGGDDPSVGNAGTTIAFLSDRELVPSGNPDGNLEVFFWDQKKGFAQITDTDGNLNGGVASNANGTRIAFFSTAELVPGGNTDGGQEVFLFDKKTGFRQITNAPAATCFSGEPAITPAGTRIAFTSSCNLTGNNADGNSEIFLFDVKKGLTQVTNTSAGGSVLPALIPSAKRIAFLSTSDLTGGNADGNFEAFLFDHKKGFTQLSNTTEGQGQAAGPPAISNNGKRIAFELNGIPAGGTNAEEEGEIYLAEED